MVIVEPEGLYRDLLGSVLSKLKGLEVVGSFENGNTAVKAAQALRPEVVVLDMELSGPNGIQLAIRLRQLLPDLGVVLLSNSRDIGYLSALPNDSLFGWCYLVNKSAHNVRTLGRAVQVTAAHLMNLHESNDGYSEGQASDWSFERGAPFGRGHAKLSARQMEILALVAQGMSNAAVARVLQLKEKTIENQLAFIYEKLEIDRERSVCHPRVRAVLWYLEDRTPRLEAHPS